MSASIMHAVNSSNVLQRVLVDDNGHLQIDVLSGGGNTEFLNDATYNSGSSKGSVAMGLDASNADLQFIAVDANGHLQVDVLTTASHAVTNAGTFAVQSTLQAGSANIGKIEVMGNTVSDGSGTDKHLLTDTSGHLQVDVLSAPTTAITGSITVTSAVTDARVSLTTGDGSSTSETLRSSTITLSTSKGQITIFGDFKTEDNGTSRTTIPYTKTGLAFNKLFIEASHDNSAFFRMGPNFEITVDSNGRFGATFDLAVEYIKIGTINEINNSSNDALDIQYAFKT